MIQMKLKRKYIDRPARGEKHAYSGRSGKRDANRYKASAAEKQSIQASQPKVTLRINADGRRFYERVYSR